MSRAVVLWLIVAVVGLFLLAWLYLASTQLMA